MRMWDSKVRSGMHRVQIQDLIANRHVPRRGVIDTVLVAVAKNCNEEQHPYYMVRCQKERLKSQLDLLRLKYPDMEVKVQNVKMQMPFTAGIGLRETSWGKKTTTRTTLAYLKSIASSLRTCSI